MASERAVRPRQDISELLQTGEPVVLAVDQVPFEVESRGVKNTFCLLVPLMTDEGADLDRSEFRNRERVWWMLRPEIAADEIQVGTIWSGPIERSRAYGNPGKEKDHYQVRRSEIRPGARQFVEVLNLSVAHPDLSDVLSPEGIPWPYPPLPRVVVRGGLSVLGPFHTRYDFERGRVILTAVDESTPTVWRVPKQVFEEGTELREFSYVSNQWDAKGQEGQMDLTLLHERELEVVTAGGEPLDGATDTQVIFWALDFMESPESSRKEFRELMANAAKLAERTENDEHKERLGRFVRLCENRERVIELGSDVAGELGRRDGFRELVDRHIEDITAARIESAIAARSDEIAAATASGEERLAEIEKRTAELEQEYEKRRQAWEDEFQRQYGERAKRLDEFESELEQREREMKSRLEGLIALYREESDRFAMDLVAQLPVMQRLGMIGFSGGAAALPSGGEAVARAVTGPGPAQLELPEFLERPRDCGPEGSLDEEKFVEQFRDVVERHGFVFDDEDLINFHVLMKTGLWTVLAGASGLGKSSLPRFYAEALGCEDEYLLVPVRPDWLDDRDVIGAYNSLSSRYEPAPCGLVDRLIAAYEDAQRGRGGIYVICMDEMNLARVEHYFAQFLSVLEQPVDDRHLYLFARGMLGPDDPYAKYRKLRIGHNVRIVGTVNVDETTHFFSPKVIDRVSIAHFERPDLRQGLQDNDYLHEPLDVRPVHIEQYERWVSPPDQGGDAVELVLKAEDCLRRSRCGLGFRVRDRVLRYVSSARRLLGEDRAIDLALVQNVLPGLRPIVPRYMELLRDLGALFPEARFRRTATMLKALEEDPESDFFQLL